MENTKNISKLPTAPGTKKTYYCDEILTAYEVAVRNANLQKPTILEEISCVCEEVYKGESKDEFWGDEQTLNKMRLGIKPPNYHFLAFIKKFAGEKYNYMFLAPTRPKSRDDKPRGTETKIKMTPDGYLCMADGSPFSASHMTDEMMCALFEGFVGQKHACAIAEDVLFYDYLQTEAQKRREQDPLFYDYDPALKALVLRNLGMVNDLPETVWLLVQSFPNDRGIGTATWALIDQLIPSLEEQSSKSKAAQRFICVRDRVESQTKPDYDEIGITEYQAEFIWKIPHLTADEWNAIIKLVTLHDLNQELYTEVANLMLQALKVRQHTFAF